jgi:hypothetical protein
MLKLALINQSIFNLTDMTSVHITPYKCRRQCWRTEHVHNRTNFFLQEDLQFTYVLQMSTLLEDRAIPLHALYRVSLILLI